MMTTEQMTPRQLKRALRKAGFKREWFYDYWTHPLFPSHGSMTLEGAKFLLWHRVPKMITLGREHPMPYPEP